MDSARLAPWMRPILWMAALYNLVWCALLVTSPLAPFRWLGLTPPNYPELVMAIGGLVGLSGLGYALAGIHPLRFWPISLVGLLGKLGGLLVSAVGVGMGRMPLKAALLTIPNDVIWCLPFGVMVYRAYQDHIDQLRTDAPEILRLALRARTNHGHTIEELSRRSPLMLVFLRHAGCPFCREALGDIARQRAAIEAAGARIVLVHMNSEFYAEKFFDRYRVGDIERISDPAQGLYRAFGLRRGGPLDVFGPYVWLRGVHTALIKGNWLGRFVGDAFQMPGVFVMFHGEVIRSYIHHTAADRPNYAGLLAEASSAGASSPR